MSDLRVYRVANDAVRLSEDYGDHLVILAAEEDGGVDITIAQGKQRVHLPAAMLVDLYLKAMQAAEFAGYRSDA